MAAAKRVEYHMQKKRPNLTKREKLCVHTLFCHLFFLTLGGIMHSLFYSDDRLFKTLKTWKNSYFLCTYKNSSGPYKITYSKMSVEITPMEEQNKPIKKPQLEGLGPNLFA